MYSKHFLASSRFTSYSQTESTLAAAYPVAAYRKQLDNFLLYIMVVDK